MLETGFKTAEEKFRALRKSVKKIKTALSAACSEDCGNWPEL